MYKVEILSNEEFKAMSQTDPRYARVDDDNLGFADPVKKTAYVRHTAWPDLNKYLINHEFDHLLEEEGTDEDENGIRHKKKSGFGRFLQTFYNPLNIGGMGPLSKEDKGVFNTDNQSSARAESAAGIGEGGESPMSMFSAPSYPSGGFQVSNPGAAGATQLEGSQLGGGLNSSTLTSNLSNSGDTNGLDPALLQRLRGFYSGRVSF